MNQYHKIQTVWLRDPDNNHKTLLDGQYARPEFEYLKDLEWIWTEKVDGTNTRVMLHNGTLSFGGKTANAQIPVKLLNALEAQFRPKLDQLNEAFPDGCCLYGEGYGARIQKGGGNYRADNGFVLFDVKVGKWWLERSSVEEIAVQHGIDIVPVIGRGTLPEMIEFVQQGFSSRWGDFPAEGIVARPSVQLFNRKGERVITKLKCKDFR